MSKRMTGLVALGALLLSFGLAAGAQAQELRVGPNYKLDSDPSRFRARDMVGMAVHRTDPQRLVAINANYLDLRCEASFSTDGGATWSTAVALVAPAGHSQRCGFHQSVQFGTGLNVYAVVTATKTNAAFGDTSVIIYRSVDGGATWLPGVPALPGGAGTNDPTASPSLGPSFTRPALTVDPGQGTAGADRVYAVARDFVGTGNGGVAPACTTACDSVRVAVSNDGALTFGDGVGASPAGLDTADPAPVVVNSDRSVTVAWRTTGANGLLQAARSTTAGATWSAPIDIAGVKNRARFGVNDTHIAPPPGGTGPFSSTSSFPRMASDPTRAGWIYLVYGDPLSGPTAPPPLGFQGTDHFINYDQQIYFQRSKDNGLTWSEPKRVSDPATYPGSELIQTRHPNVSVSPNGRVNIVWHDRRHWFQGPGERLCTHSHIFCEDIRLGDTYLSTSTNGGDTFSPNIRVTDRSHNNDVGYDTRPASGYWSWGPVSAPLGNNSLLVGWMDSREGNWDTDTEDFYLAKVDFSASGAAPQTVIEEPSTISRSVRLGTIGYRAGNEGALVGGARDPANQNPTLAGAPGGPASRNASAVVIANETDLAGAMAATVLARANPAPVLLSPAAGLTANVKAEITRIRPARVYLVGGADKLSAAVATDAQVAAGILSPQVVRIDAGSDAGTAAQIAALLDYRIAAEKDGPGLMPAFHAAVIVNPATPDAAAAVGLAAARRLPILMVEQDSVPAATAAALGSAQLDITKTLVIGGTSSISAGVLGALPNPTRLGGADQYATSDAVVAESTTRGMPHNVVYVADGTRPMDATLLAGVVARATGMLLLAPPPVQQTAAARAAANGLTGISRMDVVEPNPVVVPPPPPPPVAPPPPPPDAPPPPPPPPAAADTTAPGMKLAGAAIQKLGPTVAITVTCTTEPCTAVVKARIAVPKLGRTKAKTFTLKSVSAKLQTNVKRTVRLRISALARTRILRALRLRKSVSARFTVTATDAAGNKRTATRAAKFRR